MDIKFWALEAGYLRPDFVTMEEGGVNANSPLSPLRANLAHCRNDSPFENNIIVGKSFGALARYDINGLISSVSLSRF
ncbi:MAG: hypothetical protein LPD71_02230 [Shewanella sp.]|nr:hypothetical protein [Shewanella sp.]MCF1430751.1 hypothetical protein [Shewanella sp.]MCF1437594.1 hypothetical protein [Shewanella sp.]MCF1457539.1 hypothetical protein [Shewanella sp.]